MMYDKEIKRTKDFSNISYLFKEEKSETSRSRSPSPKSPQAPRETGDGKPARRSRGDISYFVYYKYKGGRVGGDSQRTSFYPRTSSLRTS